MSESKRGIVRIASNYFQLFGTVLLGLALYPLILRGMGTEALGFIALMGSTLGLASLVEAIVRRVMIHELGSALHREGGRDFVATYSATIQLSLAASFITLLAFGIVLICLPLFKIPESLLSYAYWFIGIKAVESAFVVALGPITNMWMVLERMVASNMFALARSACGVCAACVIAFVVDWELGPSLVLYAAIESSVAILVTIVSTITLTRIDRRMALNFRSGTKQARRGLLGMGVWNVAVVLATNMNIKVDMIIMNIAFGLVIGNATFGVAMALSIYIRRIATGITRGIDVVAVRLSHESSQDSMLKLIVYSTRLHGVVTFLLAALVIILAEPIVHVWLGSRLIDSERTQSLTVVLIQILAIGASLRAIVDGWIFIFYGAGQIRSYAPWIVASGVFNPPLAVLLIWVLPENVSYTGPAWSYAILTFFFQAVAVPLATASKIGMQWTELMRPLVRPALVALASSTILLIAVNTLETWNLPRLILVASAYGIVGMIGMYYFAFTNLERNRLKNTVSRKLNKKATPSS